MNRSDLPLTLFNSYYGELDLKKHHIELHVQSQGLPPGVLGIMLGELLGDRYSYKISEPVDVDVEKIKLYNLDNSSPGPEHGPRRHFVNNHLTKHIPNGCNLLDFGCGTARYKDYYNVAGKVTGVDINPHALIHLRAFYPDPNKYNFVVAPFCLTDLPDSAFDCILISAVLGYVPNSIANIILDECSRLLRPGGKLIVGLVPTAGIFRFGSNLSLLHELKSSPGSFHCKYKNNEVVDMLSCRGYSVESRNNYIVKLPHLIRKTTNYLYKKPVIQLIDIIINSINCWFSTWQIVVGYKKP